MGGRGWTGAVCALGLWLSGCREAKASSATPRPPGVEEAVPVAGEGVGTTEWTRTLASGDSQALRAAVAPNGDVLVVATYGEPLDLGKGPLPFNRDLSTGHLMVARFGADGTLRWARGLVPGSAGPPRVQVAAVAVDPGGDVLLGGTSAGFAWDGTRLPEGPFLARLTAEGALTWARGIPGEGPFTVASLAVDAAGDVVVGGDFAGRRDFGDGERQTPRDSGGAFVARFGGDGSPRWSRAYVARGGPVHARAVAAGSDGAVWVVGDFAGVVSFGDATFVTVRDRAPFVLKLSPEGAHRWSRELPGVQGSAQAVAEGLGGVFVGGTYTGRFRFGGGEPLQSDWQDGFVLAYGVDGEERWARSLAASATALATDAAGQVVVAGTHDGGRDLGLRGGGPGLYVTKLLPEDGASAWARGFTGSGALHASAVAVTHSGHPVVGGSVGRPHPPSERAVRDGFLLRLAP